MKVRHLVLGLLSISVIAPIFLYTDRVGIFFNPSSSRRDFLDDIAAFTVSGDTRHLNVLPQETSTALKEPIGIVYSDHSTNSFPNESREHKSTRVLSTTNEERQPQLHNPMTIRQVTNHAPANLTPTLHSHSNASHHSAIKLEQQPTQSSGKIDQKEHSDNKSDRRTEPADAQVRHLKDQLIRAKVYLSLPAIKNNPHVTRELRLRIKEVSRALGDAAKDTDLPKNAFDKLKAMEQSLEKGKQIQDDCTAVVKKLQAMLHSTEEQLRVHKKQTMFLTQLTAKTLPKGLHCLPLRLTTEYYTLNSSQQNFLNQEKLEDPQLYHYALFSDNVLAAAVVVNSTVSHAKNHDRQFWKLGTLPPGLITFWKRTYPLNRSWHVLGLGYSPNVNQREIERAAVIHYNGNLKPWLEIGIPKYKSYWAKYVDYDLMYLRDCNINP